MGTWRQVVSRFALFSFALLAHGFFSSCASTLSSPNPPETYKGPMAERPSVQQGDYWVYERANGTRIKTAGLVVNVAFPLWIGRKWSFAGSAVRIGQPATSPFQTPTTIDCYVVAYKPIEVSAGAFQAFECECQCTHLDGGLEPGCGQWTVWYAPAVKNVIKLKTESTATSMELIEYKASRPTPDAKVAQKK